MFLFCLDWIKTAFICWILVLMFQGWAAFILGARYFYDYLVKLLNITALQVHGTIGVCFPVSSWKNNQLYGKLTLRCRSHGKKLQFFISQCLVICHYCFHTALSCLWGLSVLYSGRRNTALHKPDRENGESRWLKMRVKGPPPSAHDVKWEAQPGALNPLSTGLLFQSASTVFFLVNGMAETVMCCTIFVHVCVRVCMPATGSLDARAHVSSVA